MHKRYLLISIIAIFALSIFRFSLAETITTDREVFDTRLTKLLRVGLSPEASDEERGFATEELIKFSSEYPNSEFVSDAQVVPNLILFGGASSQGKKDIALSFINKIEIIASKYPEGKLSDFTCEKWRELLGQQSSGVIFIPYKYLPAYMRGALGMDFRDLQAAVDNFSLLKENLYLNKDTSGMLAYEIYAPLLIAYKSLGKMEELNMVAKEATEKFPNNAQLIQTINRLNADSKSTQ